MMKGDSHRFGKFVSFHHDDLTICKPRNIDLEYLFLSPKSPLKKFQNELGLKFEDEAYPKSTWSGEVENLTPFITSNFSFNDEILIDVAKFMATASILGLNDLHKENILFTIKDSTIAIKPIDLEIVNYQLASLADTGLIPSPKCPDDSSGLYSYLITLNDVQISRLIDEFIDAYNNVFKLKDEIWSLLNSELENTPIRMLYRPTRDYAKYLESNDKEIFTNNGPLTREEKVQLDAKDIPYFFTWFNQPEKMLYFSSPENLSEVSELYTHLSHKRHFTHRDFLDKNNEIFLIKSVIHLIVSFNLITPNHQLNFSGKNYHCHRHGTQLKLKLKETNFLINL